MTQSRPFSFLVLLFISTICNSMTISFTGFYLIEGLQQEPWSISVYTCCFAIVVIFSNRHFSKRMDQGADPFPMIGLAVTGYAIAALALTLWPMFVTVLTVGAFGFGLGSSALSTLFSVGGVIAERHCIERSTFNAYMRATTSTSWMIGPALSFTLADQAGSDMVFGVALTMALAWFGLWFWIAPRNAATPAAKPVPKETEAASRPELRIALVFVFFLALAHALTFSALPLFFVQEAGLPGYAPGVAFSMKTLVELVAVFSTPYLIARFGLGTSLIGTARLAVVAILVLATVQSLPHMLVGAALEGIYFGLFSTLAISFVQSLSKDRPAHATALYWNIMMITLAVAGPSAGLIAQLSDFQTVIFTGSAFALMAALLLGWHLRRCRSEAT